MSTNDFLRQEAVRIQRHLDEMIPGHMHAGIMRWLWDGIPPGTFLIYVLENNLKNAALNADLENSKLLATYANFFTWYMPSECWGSVEKVDDWARRGGWNGMMDTGASAQDEGRG